MHKLTLTDKVSQRSTLTGDLDSNEKQQHITTISKDLM